MAATRTVRGAGGIDTSDFAAVAKALKKAQPAMRLELLRNLRAAGNVVAADARSISSEFSETIPPTIKTQVRGTGVSVVAGGEVAIAGLFELGNKGEKKSAALTGRSKFRHPVFGRDVWVEQEMHPFLEPAAKKNEGKTAAAVLDALDKVTEIIVFDDA